LIDESKNQVLGEKGMWKYRIVLAWLCGFGILSVLLLLLNISSLIALSILLLPGAILTALLPTNELEQTLLMFAANALVYSMIAFAGIVFSGRDMAIQKIRAMTCALAIPVAVLVSLACVPRLSPLWPRGIAELTRKEKALQDSLPLNMGVETARRGLSSQGIAFREETVTSQTVLLERQNRSISAAPGDHYISARVETEAVQYPCGYVIQVILLFGQDERMKDQYVQRERICP
jgi:hypothetical protein